MTPLNLKPRFMSEMTIQKKRVVECEKCHAERNIPDGQTAITSICNSCMLELEYDLKKRAGTLKEGEVRPRRKLSSQELLGPNAMGLQGKH